MACNPDDAGTPAPPTLTPEEIHGLRLVNLHLEAQLCDKDLVISRLQGDLAEARAAQVEARFRELLQPPADHVFHWQARQFVAPGPVVVPPPSATTSTSQTSEAPPVSPEGT